MTVDSDTILRCVVCGHEVRSEYAARLADRDGCPFCGKSMISAAKTTRHVEAAEAKGGG